MSKDCDRSKDCVATFVAGPDWRFSEAQATHATNAAGLSPTHLDWLEPGVALDVFFGNGDDARIIAGRLRQALAPAPVDVIVQPVVGRRKRLLVSDMDSTMIAQECLDELADCCGLREEISAITQQAMRGELEFETALRARVALLAGVTQDEIQSIVARLTPNPGARRLVATMRAHGAWTALVTGGFAPIADAVAARLGFNETRANRLAISENALTGEVASPVLGRAAKRMALEELRRKHNLSCVDTLAVGDGANDLDMLGAAGLGVAWRARPVVAEAAMARLDYADLTALLFAQGYRRGEFVA